MREDGRVRYVGFAVPECVYIDYGVIESAPAMINRAGIGDVLCFISGVMDWQYAETERDVARRVGPTTSLLREFRSRRPMPCSGRSTKYATSRRKGWTCWCRGLRWGGASYHGAGWNPRHIEGVEHYVFYALEAGTGRKFLHGQAVCLGLVAGCMMHGARDEEMLDAVHRVGLDIRPQAMAVTWNDVDEALFGLAEFVREESLPYGIAHDFLVDDTFCERLRRRIEAKYGAWPEGAAAHRARS